MKMDHKVCNLTGEQSFDHVGGRSEDLAKAVVEAEQQTKVYAVIMAGGAGTRFWPLSRAALPKQFLDLPECNFDFDKSMLKQTARRLLPFIASDCIFVATNRKYAALAANNLPWLRRSNLVEETRNLDTAFGMAGALAQIGHCLQKTAVDQGAVRSEQPADSALPVSAAAPEIDLPKPPNRKINRQNLAAAFSESVVIFLPCDHYIADAEQFRKDLAAAVSLAKTGKTVTLGISPKAPLTGYGYLLAGSVEQSAESGSASDIAGVAGDGAAAVYYSGLKFIEKPHKAQAAALLQQQNVFWNSGIFVGRAGVFIDLLASVVLGEVGGKEEELSVFQKINLIKSEMEHRSVRRSFDRLIMENLAPGDFLIVPAAFGWDDLGTFSALAKYWQQENGNSVNGCRIAADNSQGNIVYREGGLVALVDVENLLIAETDGVLLIMPKDSNQNLKKLVQLLKKQDLQEYL